MVNKGRVFWNFHRKCFFQIANANCQLSGQTWELPAFNLTDSLREVSHYTGFDRKRRDTEIQLEDELPDLYDDIRFTQWQADYAEEVMFNVFNGETEIFRYSE